MAKPELGSKRLCASCGAKFYDLNKTPIACPKCGTPFEVVPVTTRPRPDKRVASREPEVEAEEVEGAELISLEEADAEAQGKQAEAAEDVEADQAIEDDAEGPIIEQERRRHRCVGDHRRRHRGRRGDLRNVSRGTLLRRARSCARRFGPIARVLTLYLQQ